MKVIILCGGLGTRLREETEFRPKPLVEVGGRPILWHIMKTYAHHGFTEFVLTLGYKGNLIKEYFLNYEAMNNDLTIQLGSQSKVSFHNQHNEQDFTVSLIETGHDSQTGSRVKRVERYVDGDTFMVTYGDGVADIDIKKLLAFHRSHGKLATISTVRMPGRFGVVESDETGRVTNFREKPAHRDFISMGYFVFQRPVFDVLSVDPTCILEREPLERLAHDGQLMTYRHEGDFYPMDTVRDHAFLNDLWSRNKASWRVD
jgi:glucose-1-phosphate cytidylyltransferase